MEKTVYGFPLHSVQTNIGTDNFMGLEVHYITAPSSCNMLQWHNNPNSNMTIRLPVPPWPQLGHYGVYVIYGISSTPGLAYRHSRRVQTCFIFAFCVGTHKLEMAIKLSHSTTNIGKNLQLRQDLNIARAIRN
jgi:hypothetical protein